MPGPSEASGAETVPRLLALASAHREASQDPGSAPKGPAAPGLKKKKAAKVRSAWISFVGRVVAQLTGAVATVVLGVIFLHRYSVVDKQQGTANPAGAVTAAVVRPAGQVTFAVLPFQNLTGDPREEHVADGLTETVTADLASAGGLHVVSRTSAMRFKSEHRPMPEIARELGADLVVEGSISKAGSRVRVTAQLIDARADDHLWAKHYELTEHDPLTMEGEIAGAIARDLRAAAARKTGTEPVGITRSGSLR
jgi:TolB-like protein